MKRLINVLIIYVLFPLSTYASGMPIFDGMELTKQISDSLYFISSIDTLLKEVGGDTAEIQALASMSRELRQYQQDIALYQQLGGAIDDLSNPVSGRSRVLVDQINSVTRHLRKLKVVLSLAQTIGARPAAINASMQVLRDERAREKERFEVALKAYEEKEKISKLRRRLTKKIKFKQSLAREVEIINGYSSKKAVSVVSIKDKDKSMDSLW